MCEVGERIAVDVEPVCVFGDCDGIACEPLGRVVVALTREQLRAQLGHENPVSGVVGRAVFLADRERGFGFVVASQLVERLRPLACHR